MFYKMAANLTAWFSFVESPFQGLQSQESMQIQVIPAFGFQQLLHFLLKGTYYAPFYKL